MIDVLEHLIPQGSVGLTAFIYSTEVIRVHKPVAATLRRFRTHALIHVHQLGRFRVYLVSVLTRLQISLLLVELQCHMILIGINEQAVHDLLLFRRDLVLL